MSGSAGFRPAPPEDWGDAKPEDATDFIIEMIETYGKELYWVKRPYDGYCESASERSVCWEKKVGAVYIMGGALATPGNIGNVMEAVMEANVRLDVKACYEVLTSKLPVVLVGWM